MYDVPVILKFQRGRCLRVNAWSLTGTYQEIHSWVVFFVFLFFCVVARSCLFEAIFGAGEQYGYMLAWPLLYYLICPILVALMCKHFVFRSLRRFMHCGLLICFNISAFSEVQRSHDFFPGTYVWHCLIIVHFILGSGFRLFVHIKSESVVHFLLFSDLNECLCWLNRSLNLRAVMPI